MRRIGRIIVNALTVLSLLLCVAALALWVDHHRRTRPGTIIRPGMELEVRLTELIPPVSKLVTVDLSGRIELPLFGNTKASGLTCAELRSQLDDAYNRMGSLRPLGFDVRIRGFYMPSALGMGLLLTIPALRLLHRCWLVRRKWWRLNMGLCRSCAYDLTGNISGVCPECGTPVPALTAAVPDASPTGSSSA